VFIENFIREHRYSPSYEEIGAALNVSSISTVAKHIKNLETRGYVTKGAKNNRRAVAIVTNVQK
jgi:repressor LexA